MGNVLTHIVSTVPIDYTQDYARNDELSRSFIPSSSNLNLNYTFSNLDNSAIGWLDFVEVNVKRNLSFSGSFLPFQTATNVGTGLVSKFQLANTTSSVSIWDITNLFDAREQQTNQIGTIQEFSLTTPILRHFISFDRSASATFTTPSFIEKIDNLEICNMYQPQIIFFIRMIVRTNSSICLNCSNFITISFHVEKCSLT